MRCPDAVDDVFMSFILESGVVLIRSIVASSELDGALAESGEDVLAHSILSRVEKELQ